MELEMENPLARLNVYSVPAPDGGCIIQIRWMVNDLIAVAKSQGITTAQFIDGILAVWDETPALEIIIPEDAKN